MKKLLSILTVFAVLFTFTACSSSEDPSGGGEKKEGTYLIGVSMKTMSDEFSNTLGEAIKTGCRGV